MIFPHIAVLSSNHLKISQSSESFKLLRKIKITVGNFLFDLLLLERYFNGQIVSPAKKLSI